MILHPGGCLKPWAIVSGFLLAFLLCAPPSGAQTDVKAKARSERKPSPSLTSLPKPAASGPLKILVVDDDWTDNNAPGRERAALSRSDRIFRERAEAAVAGDAARWSVAFGEIYRNGPDLARLRDYNVVIWYNGGQYGGNSDNAAVLSRDDETTVRGYLEEVGGSVIFVSPGFLANFAVGNTWTSAPVPFLKEVAGIDGFSALSQRFEAGVVTAWDGSTYTVQALGHPEAQFSGVNPDGAAVVFHATLDPRKTADGPVPVAVAHPYGRGRFVYVGFSFENLPEAELAPAFNRLLEAAGWPQGVSPVGTTPESTSPLIASTFPSVSRPRVENLPVDQTVLSGRAGGTTTSTIPAAATLPIDPALRDMSVREGTAKVGVIGATGGLTSIPPESSSTGSPPASEATPEGGSRPASTARMTSSTPPTIRSAKIRIFTGNDNKEAPSNVVITLYRNGGEPDDPFGFDITKTNPLRLTRLGGAGLQGKELAINSTTELVLRDPSSFRISPEYHPSLASCEEHGLRLEISYEPNFFLDAWRINRVELEIDFAVRESWTFSTLNNRDGRYYASHTTRVKSAPGFPKVITFITGGLLKNSNKKLTYITDGFFMQKF